MVDKVISIDCGGTNLRVGVVDSKLNLIAAKRGPSIYKDPEALYQTMKKLIYDVCKEANVDEVKAIGMSICGIVESNHVGRCGNLGFDSFDFLSRFEKDFPKAKFLFANDANCSALVEAEYGSNRGFANSAFVTISTGIGLGIIHNGEMIDLPLEGGRLKVEYQNQIYETEYLLSGNGIVNLCHLNNVQIASSKEFFDGIRAHDAKMLEIYQIWIKKLALWFANIHLLFNPDQYSLSGGVMKSADVFLNDLINYSNEFVAGWGLKPIRFVNAKFLQDVGLAAGGALAWHILNK